MSSLDLVARANLLRETRVDPQHAETLKHAQRFLLSRECLNQNEATHIVTDDYPDWWMPEGKSIGALVVGEDEEKRTFWKHVAALCEMGIPLTLQERRAPQMKLVVKMVLKGANAAVDDLVNPQGPVVRMLGQTVCDLFRPDNFRDAVVFSSSGFREKLQESQTTVRFVFTTLVVTVLNALAVRDSLLGRLKKSRDPDVEQFLEKIKTLCSATEMCGGNQLDEVLPDLHFSAGQWKQKGLRMPYNDAVAPAPLKKPQGTPLRPWGVLRFSFSADGDQPSFASVERIVKPEDLEDVDWLQMGVSGMPENSALSQFHRPANLPTRATVGGGGGGGGGVGRSAGGIRLRTTGGSGPMRVSGATAARSRTEHSQIEEKVLRYHYGTADEWQEIMRQKAGAEDFDENAVALVWNNPSGGRVEFRPDNNQVWFVGNNWQVRQLLEALPEFEGKQVASADDDTRSRSSRSQSGAPGQVFAPSKSQAGSDSRSATYSCNRSLSARSSMSAAAATTNLKEVQSVLGSRRVVTQAVTGETDGEISLATGDFVTITDDSDKASADAHRWVFVTLESSGAQGWAPLNHTGPASTLPVVSEG